MSTGVSEVRGRTILVAEDDAIDALLLRSAFSKAGLEHTLKFVLDGQEAIDYLQSKPPYTDPNEFPAPDLLLLDLKMPRVDGFDVLRWMQRSGLDQLPVLVLSGSDLDSDKQQALGLGAREYHVKSADLALMIQFFKDLSTHWLEPASPAA